MTTPANPILSFLADIAANNNKPWFDENRSRYEEARTLFELKTSALIEALATIEPAVAHLTVKDCTYRFHRDTRFSPDKSPYKRHFGAYINPHGRKSPHGGYYMHIEPGSCFVAGGAWQLEPKVLRAVRQSIVDDIDEFRSIVEAPPFSRYYKEIGLTSLKTMPKGFDKDFPHARYIRCKDYSVSHPVPDDFYFRPDWLTQTLTAFRAMKPYLDFINYTIDDYAE